MHTRPFSPVREVLRVPAPDRSAHFLDSCPFLELAKQERRKEVRGQIAGAEVDPRVFVDLTLKELGPVGALLANDPSPFEEG